MAGIYVHIPFCKVKCHYCDFHFSVNPKNQNNVATAICNELIIRKNYLGNEKIQTIYFGGGTPSVLNSGLIENILTTIHKNYSVNADAEITFECNPDDLSKERLATFLKLGINRLSIGIQSFNDDVLTFMNRAHTAKQAIESIHLAQNSGFNNCTIDLIYGVPGSTLDTWKKELDTMLKLNIPHLSAYCLTIEEKTVFGNWLKKGKLKPFADTESLAQFQYLIDFSQTNGYEQYEISNFSKKGFISKHNSSYWLGEKYIGIGPSAHSYNGNQRSWNVANNTLYTKLIQANGHFNEIETLSESDKFNEYILTRLRTKWGIEIKDLENISVNKTKQFAQKVLRFIANNQIIKKENIYTLTNNGKYMADAISADLFCDSN